MRIQNEKKLVILGILIVLAIVLAEAIGLCKVANVVVLAWLRFFV